MEGNPLYHALTTATPLYTKIANQIFEEVRQKINPVGEILTISGNSYLQVNHYEPEKHDRNLLQDMHEDGHLITIVKSTGPGLEVLIDGEFQRLTLRKDQLLVMPGSIMEIMTGGAIKPLYHRVLNDHQSKVRDSVMFFINPDMDKDQKPWIINETNKDLDIREETNRKSASFGLPGISEIRVAS